MKRRHRTFVTGLAATIAGAVALAAPVAPQAVAADVATSIRTSVTGPAYDAPGSAVAVVVTAWGTPGTGFRPKFTARVGSGPTDCSGTVWRHSGGAVSQRCFVVLRKTSGSQAITAKVRFVKAGATTRVAKAGSMRITARGPVSGAVDRVTRRKIERCWNTDDAIQLTFDDGYVSRAKLAGILATLKQRNVRATFLFVGSWSRANPWAAQMVRAGGHRLGNHSNTHPSLSDLSGAALNSQIRYGVRGTGTPRLIRPPYGAGAYSTRVDTYAKRNGHRACHWTTDTSDWSGVSTSTIVNKVLRGDATTAPARRGGVVLMHTTANSHAAAALTPMISGLRKKGYRLEPLG